MYSRSLREAHQDLYDVALASRIFHQSANACLYRLLEITHEHSLMGIWKSLSMYPGNATSIRYLLCDVAFDSPTAQRNVATRTSALLGHVPPSRWADGVQLSTHDLHPKDDLARRLFLDIIRRCKSLKRLHLHREAASLMEGTPSLGVAPRIPLYIVGQTLRTLVFETWDEQRNIYGPEACGERLQGFQQLLIPCLEEIEIRAWDGTWQIVLAMSKSPQANTVPIVERILSLAIDHYVHFEATPVLQPVGLQDMSCLEKFEVRTCLLIPEFPERPALPLGSHNLNHQLAYHATRLKILHIDAPIKRFGEMMPHPEGERLLTCLPSLRALISLHVSLHLLFPTLKGLHDELELEPENQMVLNAFLGQCSPTLQNIHFLEQWRPESLGMPEDDSVLEIQQATVLKLMRYMCKSWLTWNGKPQQRTLQLTPQHEFLYDKTTHPALMETENLQGLLRAQITCDKYTYRLVEEVSYRDVHKKLLPLEIAYWLQ